MILENIYVINLDHRDDRLIQVTEEFAMKGIEFTRFPAFNGMDYSGTSVMKQGAVGCAISHLTLLRFAREQNFSAIMVFEDDVVLSENFNRELKEMLAFLPQDWDMFYFGGSHREKPIRINERILKACKTLTTHAYLMRSSMYDAAIAEIERLIDPVDSVYADLQKQFNVYISDPPLAWQRESFSDIEGRQMNYDWLKTNEQ